MVLFVGSARRSYHLLRRLDPCACVAEHLALIPTEEYLRLALISTNHV